jgi:AraC-like DNA-binding protein
VRAAAAEDDYRAAPFGAYLAGRHALHFCAREELCGFAVWGRPDAEDLRRLERLLLLELAPDFPRHVSLVDASRLDGVDALAFAALGAYVRRNRARLAAQVARLAIVRPPGLPGATVSGFFVVEDAPYPVEIVSDAAAGLRWLGERDDRVAHALEQAVAAATGTAPVLVELRRLLDARPGRVPLPEAAKLLGASARSLQRRLRDAGATYQGEVAAAQIRAAQRLLLDSALPVTDIALEVGCATPQQFSALFRRLVGEPPSAWRARRR